MRSVNKVILIGNLGSDPDMNATPTGKMITRFSVATSSEWKTDEGEKQKNTDFHRVITWQGLAETCKKYLKKGSAVYVEGRLKNRHYDKDGERKYITEINAEKVIFIRHKQTQQGQQISIEDAEVSAQQA